MATTWHERPSQGPVCECGQPCQWSFGGHWRGKCAACMEELRRAFWRTMTGQ
jgi:hypothetical protein